MPDSLKPNKKVKKLANRSASVSSEEEVDTEAKVMEEVKRYFVKTGFSLNFYSSPSSRKSLAEHQAMASQMDKEKRDYEMAVRKSFTIIYGF